MMNKNARLFRILAGTGQAAESAIFRRTVAAAMLCFTMAAPLYAAQGEAFAMPTAMNGVNEWVCDTDADRLRGWFIRCENLTDALAYDAILDDGSDVARSRKIPLYGAPYADSNLAQLAAAVLCTGDPQCRIVMAAH